MWIIIRSCKALVNSDSIAISAIIFRFFNLLPVTMHNNNRPTVKSGDNQIRIKMNIILCIFIFEGFRPVLTANIGQDIRQSGVKPKGRRRFVMIRYNIFNG